MLAPFGLKYYRPQCMFLPRNLCIMRGEIDYVASNRSIDPPGVRHPSDGMSDIWHRVDGRNWTRPDAPFLGADFRFGSKGEILARSRCFPLYPRKRTHVGHRAMSVSCQSQTFTTNSPYSLLRAIRPRGRSRHLAVLA